MCGGAGLCVSEESLEHETWRSFSTVFTVEADRWKIIETLWTRHDSCFQEGLAEVRLSTVNLVLLIAPAPFNTVRERVKELYHHMPEQETIRRAKEDAEEGKAPSTQAGEFVREEIHHVREGKHGASSAKQAIAIGLSKARRAGVKLARPKGPQAIRKKAAQDTAAGQHTKHKQKKSQKRSRATLSAVRRKSQTTASHQSLSRAAKDSADKRGKPARSAAARKAARTRRAA
jgi:hypothetical protein